MITSTRPAPPPRETCALSSSNWLDRCCDQPRRFLGDGVERARLEMPAADLRLFTGVSKGSPFLGQGRALPHVSSFGGPLEPVRRDAFLLHPPAESIVTVTPAPAIGRAGFGQPVEVVPEVTPCLWTKTVPDGCLLDDAPSCVMTVACFAYARNAVALISVRLPVALRQVHERIVVVALIGKTVAPLSLTLHTSYLVARIIVVSGSAANIVFNTNKPARFVPLVIARHPAGFSWAKVGCAIMWFSKNFCAKICQVVSV
jgi:hypothetical protein